MGTLYVVATPIGNLKDITLRALEVLKDVKNIACEDTRVTKKLLTHYGIKEKNLIPYHEHIEEKAAKKLINTLKNGEDIALVSDAGTPCISDPGYRIVKLAREEGIKVVPIPGAFAGAVALSASGLPSDKFLFVGFLNTKEGKKTKELELYKKIGFTFIVYESPKRILKTLKLYEKIMPDSEVVVAKELTKINEMFISGKPEDIIEFFEQNPDKLKGEFVILCKPEKGKEMEEEQILSLIREYKSKGFTNKEIVSILKKEFNIPKKYAYKLVLLK
jgi:16S rRNA (cytidine1402-2'-O)-methyltransferase